jgi:protein-tyrosine phosphatase
MAEGLLRRLFARAGVGAEVGSAGLLPGGAPATSDAVATMAARGVDIREHVSRTLDDELVAGTRLVVGMARLHVREACVRYGAPIERTFTLKELVRRGEQAGGRRADEPVAAWLGRVGAGRLTRDLVADDPVDDIADPVGRPRAEYEDTADELEDLLQRFVGLIAGAPTPTPAPLSIDHTGS